MSTQQTWQFVSVDPGGSSSNNDKKKRPRKKRVSKACVRCRKHKHVPCIDAEGQSPQARRQTNTEQTTVEAKDTSRAEPATASVPTTTSTGEESTFSPGWTVWEPIVEGQNMNFAESGYQFGVSQDAAANPGAATETENTAEAGGENELQFDGNWDWSTGQFLMPELWPKR